MEIAIVAAIDLENGIGKDNKLLCHLPADLRNFKQITTGHCIVMGRKTFESLPNGSLPDRKNVIITNNKQFQAEGCTIFHSVEDAIEGLKSEEKVFVIGGGQIYRQFINKANLLYITLVKQIFSADTFFPGIDAQTWNIQSKTDFTSDAKNTYDYSFIIYKRKTQN